MSDKTVTTDDESFIQKLAAEKVRLEKRLEAYSYLNCYGVKLEDAITRETDKLTCMRQLHSVNAAIDGWIKNPIELAL